MTGTLVNVGTVVVGSLLGMWIHDRLPKKHVEIAFQALGLVTLVLGVSMALKSDNMVIVILSVLIGGLLGQSLNIDGAVERSAEALRDRVASKEDRGGFSQGLITAFLMFCMGSLTIIGALEDGMGRGADLLYAKSVMDGFASMALAATFGVGVLFSVIPLLIYQGGWSVVGMLLRDLLPLSVVNEVSAVGGIILLGLGLNILETKRIPLLNLVPGLLVAVGLALLWPHLPW